jgi:AcrR family transcriptional regulator
MSSASNASAPQESASGESLAGVRSLRRDAERNRRLIIDGARVVFAERGLRGSYDDIAREAGVGVGTVYRRFPDRQQLIDALFEEALEEIVAIAEEGLAAEDPWQGLVHFLVRVQERQCADRGLREIIVSSDHGESRLSRVHALIAPRVDRLIGRAQDAGVVRDDIDMADLGIMQIAVCAVADATGDGAPDAWRRTLGVLLDGLQPARQTVQPLTASALTLDQFDAAVQASVTGRR